MGLDYGINAYRGVKEACPDAKFGKTKGIYLPKERSLENPRIILVSLKYAKINNGRISLDTKDGECADLKLNCRRNSTLSTSPVKLQLRRATDEDDVGDVAVIKFSTNDCGLRNPSAHPAVCEGLILKYKPEVLSTDEEPVKIQNGDGKWIPVPGTVKMDTGNDVATGISNKLIEKLDLEADHSNRKRFKAAGGVPLECSMVLIKLKIRGLEFTVSALVGAPAPGTDLLIGRDVLPKLHDKNFTVGE